MRETVAETARRRTTVCVKACEGIPTDLLEDGFIARLFAACLHLEDPRVRDILAELVAAVKPRTGNRVRGPRLGPGHAAAQDSLPRAVSRFA